jgi:hypothetical protein
LGWNRLLTSDLRTVGLARPEHDGGGEPERGGSREDDHRPRHQRVERPLEQEAETIDHLTAPSV